MRKEKDNVRMTAVGRVQMSERVKGGHDRYGPQ